MPQLMPLTWLLSGFMILLIFVVFLNLFYLKMEMIFFNESLNESSNMFFMKW